MYERERDYNWIWDKRARDPDTTNTQDRDTPNTQIYLDLQNHLMTKENFD